MSRLGLAQLETLDKTTLLPITKSCVIEQQVLTQHEELSCYGAANQAAGAQQLPLFTSQHTPLGHLSATPPHSNTAFTLRKHQHPVGKHS